MSSQLRLVSFVVPVLHLPCCPVVPCPSYLSVPCVFPSIPDMLHTENQPSCTRPSDQTSICLASAIYATHLLPRMPLHRAPQLALGVIGVRLEKRAGSGSYEGTKRRGFAATQFGTGGLCASLPSFCLFIYFFLGRRGERRGCSSQLDLDGGRKTSNRKKTKRANQLHRMRSVKKKKFQGNKKKKKNASESESEPWEGDGGLQHQVKTGLRLLTASSRSTMTLRWLPICPSAAA